LLERQLIYSTLLEFCQLPLFSVNNVNDSDWTFLIQNLEKTEAALKKAESFSEGAMKEFPNVMKLTRILLELRKSLSQKQFSAKSFDISWLDFDYRTISPSLNEYLSLCQEVTKSILGDQKLHDALEFLRPDINASVMKKPLQYGKDCVSTLSMCIEQMENDGVEILDKRTQKLLAISKIILLGRQALVTPLSKRDIAAVLDQLNPTVQNNSSAQDLPRDCFDELVAIGLELQYRYFEKCCKDVLIAQQVTGAVGKLSVPSTATSASANKDTLSFLSFKIQTQFNSLEDEISTPYFTSLQRCCREIIDIRDLVHSNQWTEVETAASELRQQISVLFIAESKVREGSA